MKKIAKIGALLCIAGASLITSAVAADATKCASHKKCEETCQTCLAACQKCEDTCKKCEAACQKCEETCKKCVETCETAKK